MASTSDGPPGHGAELWLSSSSAYHAAKEEEERRRTATAAAAAAGSSQSTTPWQHQAAGPIRASSARGTPAGVPACAYVPPAAPGQPGMLGPVYIEQASAWQQQMPCLRTEQARKAARNRRYTYLLLYFISAAHIALFVVAVYLNQWVLVDLVDNPLMGPGMEALLKIGATASTQVSEGHQYWRLLVSPFLGAGILHVWANVTSIFSFALFLSNQLPVWQIGLLYLTTGVSAVTTSANIGTKYVTAAGSGPAFGFIGGSCAVLLLHRGRLRNHLLSWLLLALNLAVNTFMGATPFVDNSGNTSGFVTGLLMTAGLLLVAWGQTTRKGEVVLRVAAIVLLGLAVLLPVMGIIGLNAGLPLGGCCDDWVCAPTPWWNCAAASQASPDTCTFTSLSNGTTLIGCPQQGQAYQIPSALINYGNTSAAVLDSLCQSYCMEQGSTPGSSGAVRQAASGH